jgi:hypothetical protein
MKKMIMLGLCALLIFGLGVTSLDAGQDQVKSDAVAEERSPGIKELTIRNSGFRSRSAVVIRYREEDRKIVEVIENGKSLAPEEFARYESIVREVLEIPQIDRLLPEIERTKRRAESQRISEESKIREMLELRRRMEGMESDAARRYREINELLLMEELNSLTERIGESSHLSQEEKIAQLKDVLAKIKELELEKSENLRRSRLMEFGATNAARRLIEEIDRSPEISREAKIREIREILQHMHDREQGEGERHRDLVEHEAAAALKKMMAETARREDLSDLEKEKEFAKLLQEARDMRLETSVHMIGIEKFKYDLYRLLEKEGLFPKGKAEFVLKRNATTIDGKKIPKDVHERIMQLCAESIGLEFGKDTKIVLQLNENR